MKTLEYEDYELQDRNGYPLGYGSGIELDDVLVYSYLKLTLTDDSVVTIDETNITPETIAEYKSRIKAVELGENIESVANDTFRNISTLESVKLNYAGETGNYAFGENNALTEVALGKNVTSIGNNQFQNCGNLININIPNSVTTIGNGAFENCSGLASVTIPNSVTTIGNDAFRICTGLTSVTIPNSVTSIGEFAFGGCSGLESISVESGNTKYDSRDNCNAIIETATNTLIVGCKNTIIPNSVTTIGSGAFFDCSGLTSVTIGNSIETIENNAFLNCTNLTNITINATTPPELGYLVFDPSSANYTIYVPTESVSAYKAASSWSSYVDRIQAIQ